MMTEGQHSLVSDYLTRLRAEAAARLPADRAAELVDDLTGHLREATAEAASEADVRNAVDRLGTPAEVVDEAGGSTPPTQALSPAGRNNAREMLALGLLVGSTLLFLLWPLAVLLLVAGLVLAFLSSRWSGTDKLLAVLAYGLLGAPTVVVAGLLSFGGAGGAQTCAQQVHPDGSGTGPLDCSGSGGGSGWVGVAVLVLVAAFDLWVTVRLYRRARRA